MNTGVEEAIGTMKALVFQGPAQRVWEDKPKPEIHEATDAPGDTVAIVGAGPIGLAVLLTAQLYSPSQMILIDSDEYRLKIGRELGANEAIDFGKENVAERIREFTGGEGVDVAIEAVGVPESFDTCQAIIAPGGRIANVGVHGKAVEFRLDRLWDRNITLTTRLVDTVSTPMLLKLLVSGKLDVRALATHRFKLDETMKAYDTFANSQKEHALKVLIKAQNLCMECSLGLH